ncbi:MAG TPA: PIN domain-containing protein [Streptosporangiaceae bacterium]|nr:PIN domain-containing protein [Streptosporangiaceae bacterium]
MNMSYVYDAGALIAIDSKDKRMWLIHERALAEGREIIIPAIVVGQAWRDGRKQALLARFLRTCQVEPTDLETAKAAGVLCGQARSSDVVDATVMVTALAHHANIVTSDHKDMTELAKACGAQLKPVVIRA